MRLILYATPAVCLILGLLSSCGIYAIDRALKAPYGPSISDIYLKFYGDNEDDLQGYNLWYKKEANDLYKRFSLKDGSIPTPTIIKKAGQTEQYTISTDDYSPQDSNQSFKEINDLNGTKFYFAVSSYPYLDRNIAESGKTEFGIWP
jgi:hypothetical protein